MSISITYFYIFVSANTLNFLYTMLGFIIWIIGVVLCIKGIVEIFSLEGDMAKKLIAAIVLFLTSWVGLVVYYFYARERMKEWVK